MPQPSHSLGNTNIVCLERVECKTKGDGSNAQSPGGSHAGLGNAMLGEVVNDACSVGDLSVCEFRYGRV